MKFKKLTLTNFLSYPSAVIEFDKLKGIVLIEGKKNGRITYSNGTGKTSLFESIIWGLFGDTLKPLAADDVVHNYDRNCEVSLEVDNFKIVRYRKHKKYRNETHLFINGKDRRGNSDKETQEKINNLIGATFESFINSVFLSSEDNERIKSFAASTDKERKIILERLLGNERYQDVLETIVSPTLKETKENLLREEEKVSTYIEEKKSLVERIKYLQQKHTTFEKDQHTKLLALKAQYNTQTEDYDEILKDLSAELELQTAKWQEVRQKAKEATKLESVILEKNKELSRLEAQQERIDEERQHFQDQLNTPIQKFINQDCPTCGKLIRKDDVEQYKSVITEKLQAIKAKKVVGIKPLNADIRTLLNKKDELKQETTQNDKRRVKIENIKLSISKYTNEKAREAEKKEKIKSEIKEVSKQKSPYSELIQKENERLTELKKKETESIELSSTLNNRVLYLEFFEGLFSRTGKTNLPSLPSLKIDNIIPELTLGTNRRLHQVNSDISVEFDPVSKTQRGKVQDKLSINVKNLSGAETYSGNSGGERKIIDICIMLTLGEIASSRNTKPIPFLFLDGLYDKLDSENVEKVMDLLHEEARKKESLFVTTIDPSLAALFNNRITIEKKGKISQIIYE